MVRIAKIVLATAYALACAVAILILSGQDYEWMVGERDPDGSVLTLCTIPAPTDNDTSEMAMLALILVVALLAPGLIGLIRRRRIGLPLALSLGLLALWGYRFFGRTAFC
jgi:hypothetical protein